MQHGGVKRLGDEHPTLGVRIICFRLSAFHREQILFTRCSVNINLSSISHHSFTLNKSDFRLLKVVSRLAFIRITYAVNEMVNPSV